MPERRAGTLGPEEPDRFARSRRIYFLVVAGGPLAGKPQKLHDELGTEKPGCGHPAVVERVEEGPEVGAWQLGGDLKEPVLGIVALAAQQTQIVTQDVRGDALHGVRRTLGWSSPCTRVEVCQGGEQRAPLWTEHVEHDGNGTGVEHGSFLVFPRCRWRTPLPDARESVLHPSPARDLSARRERRPCSSRSRQDVSVSLKVRPREDGTSLLCIEVLAEVHQLDGYPTHWPLDPVAFIAPDYEIDAW